MGVFAAINEHASSRWWLMPAPSDSPSEQENRAAMYHESADKLRQLAAEVRFDYCRREQLLSLADAFDRLADRVEGLPIKRAAD
jgi:hypothetical protein